MSNSATARAAPPLDPQHVNDLQRSVANFTADQLLWASGYLAGLAAATGNDSAAAVTGPAAGTDTWHIFYATETGNSRHVAQSLAERAREAGLAVELQDLRDYKPRALGRVTHALFVIATHGIGEPPEGSEPFFEYWLGERAPRLEDLRYSVLALGDSSYADFCEMGVKLDARLKALGATPISARVDCDLDFDAPAADWVEQTVEQASANSPSKPVPRAALRAVPSAPLHSRRNPFQAEIITEQEITGLHSSKSVHHVEIDLEGSGLDYLPGDSLGVLSSNPPALIDAVLAATKLDSDAEVVIAGDNTSLHDALRDQKEISVLSRPLLQALAGPHEIVRDTLADREQLAAFFRTRQVIDLVNDYPIDWTPQSFVDALRQLTPRLYSIASSPDANPTEAHLTIARVNYHAWGREHWGSASSFLTAGHRTAPVYIEANDHFRLPADGDTPIIMIGAGTGVAPYRAFIEHRKEHGQRGDNWLVFGDRTFSQDFLYQLEWLRYRKSGVLTRLDVAFSRDQAEKRYVQHSLLEQRDEIWHWLQRGAHLYVCGDADRMAVDVQQALLTVLQTSGGLSAEDAATELSRLKTAGRYQRDVY